MVTANAEHCRSVGELIKNIRIRKSFFERPFLKNDFPTEVRLSMLFNAVAICHQTHHLYHPGLDLYGWDYLEHVFCNLALNDSPLLKPEIVSALETTEIQDLLLRQFSVTGLPADSTLDNINERAELYRGINILMAIKYGNSFGKFLNACGNSLINKSMGFYELLAESPAFSDKMRKKSSFLLKLLFDSGLFEAVDEENFVPIVDYHMQRVLLRMGCIDVRDTALDYRLRNNLSVDTDEPVRQACIEAFGIISEVSGKKPWFMNDVFWPLGRSCCNEITLCTDRKCSKKPCTFELMAELQNHDNCIFIELCKGYQRGNPKAYKEPNVTTHYY